MPMKIEHSDPGGITQKKAHNIVTAYCCSTFIFSEQLRVVQFVLQKQLPHLTPYDNYHWKDG